MEEDGTPPSTNKNSDQGNTHINQKHIQTPNISHITNTQKKTDTEMEMEIDVIPETQIELLNKWMTQLSMTPQIMKTRSTYMLRAWTVTIRQMRMMPEQYPRDHH